MTISELEKVRWYIHVDEGIAQDIADLITDWKEMRGVLEMYEWTPDQVQRILRCKL